jgi:pimeloyl-ACP methyl ester carboxylesterase
MGTSTKTKPSIVFCHGIWADGSSFSKVMSALQAEGHEVIAAQYGLDTPEGDVATVKRTLGWISSPAMLVGHSYGGSVITVAGTDGRRRRTRLVQVRRSRGRARLQSTEHVGITNTQSNLRPLKNILYRLQWLFRINKL